MPIVKWLTFLLLFALPVTFFPFSYRAFELPKVFLLYFSSTLILYLLLLSGYKVSRLNKSAFLYLIFFGWIIISATLGLSFSQSLLGSYFRMQGILSWLCYSLLFFISGEVLAESRAKKQICLAILIGSTATALLAVAQFVSLWFLGNYSQLLYSNRVISTFGQPNFLGAYLTMSLPFAWFLLKHSPKKWQAAIGGLMVLMILGILVTFSRSAYIGLAVLALIWGIYHCRLLLAGLICAIIIFAFLANLFPELVYEQWYRFKLDTASKWTAENRLEIIQKSLSLIIKQPLTGYGLENFVLAFPKVVSSQDLGLKDIVVDSSHNLFLDIAAQTGLIGLGLFFLLLIFSFKSGLEHKKLLSFSQPANTNQSDFTNTALSTVIAFLVIHQFSPVSAAPLALMWLALGVINGSLIQQTNLTKRRQLLVNLSGGALIIAALFFMLQTIRAEMLFREANAYEVANIQKAINLDQEAIKLAPWIRFYQVRRNFLLKQLGVLN